MAEKCNHDLNSDKTTLKILDFMILTTPPKVFTLCEECGEIHTFIKNADGEYVEEIEEADQNVN